MPPEAIVEMRSFRRVRRFLPTGGWARQIKRMQYGEGPGNAGMRRRRERRESSCLDWARQGAGQGMAFGPPRRRRYRAPPQGGGAAVKRMSSRNGALTFGHCFIYDHRRSEDGEGASSGILPGGAPPSGGPGRPRSTSAPASNRCAPVRREGWIVFAGTDCRVRGLNSTPGSQPQGCPGKARLRERCPVV